MRLMSMPWSAAIRAATGVIDALTPLPGATGGADGGGGLTDAELVGTAGRGVAAANGALLVVAAITSSGFAINAITCPTGISSPSFAVTLRKIPETGASISTSVLSVATSIKGSPLVTASPSF